MLQHLREALAEKLGEISGFFRNCSESYQLNTLLDEQRETESFCLIRWLDTNASEIIPQKLISLGPSEILQVNSTYNISIDGRRRRGTILAKGMFQKKNYFDCLL